MANTIRYIDDDAGDHVFPVTHERGVLDSKGVNLESKLIRPLAEWHLTGAGNTFVSITWGGVIPGHKYRFRIISWPHDEVTQIGNTYSQCSIFSNTTANSNLLAGSIGPDPIKDVYEVETPTNCTQLIFGGRINEGEEGIAVVEDITEESSLRDIAVTTAKSFEGQDYNYHSGGYYNYKQEVITQAGWNVTDMIPVAPGDTIRWIFGSEDVSGSTAPCIVFFYENRSRSGYYSSSGYNRERTVTLPDDTEARFMAVSFSDTINGERNTTPVFINGVPWVRKERIPAKVKTEEDKHWKPFPLGKLVQYAISSSSLDLTTSLKDYRVSMAAKIAVPVENLVFRIRTPHNVINQISFILYYGYADGTAHSTTDYYRSAFPWTEVTAPLPSHAKVIRGSFRKRRIGGDNSNPWGTLTVAQVEAWLESGELSVEYYDPDVRDTAERNEAMESQALAVRRMLNTTANVNNGMNLLPLFAHISDIHGDYRRFENFMEYCDHFGVDAAINTGDATLYDHPDGTSYVDVIAGKSQTPMLFCIGNHESWPTGQATLFADNMAGLVEQQGYLKGANTPADHCYYYKDFDAKKIRVIAINYYENGVYNGCLGQTQIDWFIATLAATPEGYGVIVLVHSPEDHIITPDAPLDKFMQPSPKVGDTYQTDGFYLGNRPIMQIVDAFIGKTTLSTSYTDNGETVTISADFSEVDSTTEFIAYCTGHRHEDYVGYYEHAQHKQLNLGVVCGTALFGDTYNTAWTNQCDLPRGTSGVTQDAFNLYAIDRAGGNVRIVRVGSNVTVRFADRDMMIIPYRDNE